jgi:NAD(P)-dependent dehydrogenase (short-subunit alcohol dehydrogenase family)
MTSRFSPHHPYETHLLQHLTSGLFGTYYFLRESYEYLKARRGSVVNLASAAGVLGVPIRCRQYRTGPVRVAVPGRYRYALPGTGPGASGR